MSRSLLPTVLLVSCMPLLAHAATPAAVLEMDADGEVQIATDGHVSDYRLTTKLEPAVADLVDRSARGWKFEPVLIDGKPVLAKTHMHLRLRAEPTGDHDNVRLRVTQVSFGAPKFAKSKPPHYPEEAVAYHLGGRVLLTVKIDELGNVVDVLPYQTSLDHRANSEQQAEHFRSVLEHASITAARNWHFDMTELVNGKATGTVAMVPIVFSVSDSGKPPPNTWRAFASGPIHVAPWANQQPVDADSLKEGSALALQSQFHLKEPVDGKLL